MTIEEYSILEKYSKQLEGAEKGFVRMTMTEFKELAKVYESHFNKKVNNSHILCSHCKITILKELNRVRKELEPKMQIAENEENNNKEKNIVSNGKKNKHKRSTKTRDNEESGQSEQT